MSPQVEQPKFVGPKGRPRPYSVPIAWTSSRLAPPVLLTLLLLMLLLVAGPWRQAGALVEKECRLDSFRLPRRIQPTNYRLFLKPNLSQFTFSARLTIELLVHQDAPDGLCFQQLASGSGNSQATTTTQATTTSTTSTVPVVAGQRLPKKRRKSSKMSRPSLACDRSKIVLHAHRELNISQLEYSSADNSNQLIQVRELCRDFKNELLVVGLNADLDHQTAGQLRFEYTGPIRNDKHGFFRSEYPDAETQEPRHLLVTHFQAPHARKALPCFDEPSFKANFNLVIEHPSHLRALSNTQVLREEPVRRRREVRAQPQPQPPPPPPPPPEADERAEEAGEEPEGDESGDDENGGADEAEMTRVHFAQTPRMSTYLFAFAIGQFDHIEMTVGKLKLGIYTSPGRAHLARYALKNAARAYAALRDYFQIEQPLEKIDFVAVRELDAGAMENWGLITFTEHFLLLDEHNTTPDDINYAIDSVTHELSHQWFGNLVTMKWWDDLWLNEGFATWITHLLNTQLHPDRDGELIYLMDALNTALNSDASRKTHPIRNVRLQTVEEIEKSFDDITYEKASAVIRMLNDYMGPEQFKLGIRSYLRTNLYQNTEALDLWSSLESASQLNVRDLMTSWVDQAGFPLLRARLSQDGRTLRVDQERFLERLNGTSAQGGGQPPSDGSVGAGEQTTQVGKFREQKWVVPLAMWISNGRERTKLYKVILSERGASIKLPIWFDVHIPGHWLKLNANFGGFYRTSYDDQRLFRALRRPIEHKLMAPSDRLNLICDLFALLANEKLDMFQFDEALSWFQAEDNDAVLEVLARYIASLEAHQYPSGWNRTKLLLDFYQREGRFKPNPSNSWLKLRTRANVASSLVAIENKRVTQDAIRLFEERGGMGVPLSFRIPIFSAVARAGSADQMQRLIALVQRLDSSQSQARLVDAMTESLTGGPAKQQPAGQANSTRGSERAQNTVETIL